MSEIFCRQLRFEDVNLIDAIADWYLDEWLIPIEVTRKRLINNEDIVFQLVLLKDDQLIATGGLYQKVGLHKEYPRFGQLAVFWTALLYTDRSQRNNGYGTDLMLKIEELARERGLSKLYLYTFTAEGWYLSMGWKPIERVKYKDHDTVIMQKELL